MTDEIWIAVVSAIREETDNPDIEIAPTMTSSDVPGWDSLAHVRILLNLDARLGTRIEPKRTYGAATVGDLHAVIKDAYFAARPQ